MASSGSSSSRVPPGIVALTPVFGVAIGTQLGQGPFDLRTLDVGVRGQFVRAMQANAQAGHHQFEVVRNVVGVQLISVFLILLSSNYRYCRDDPCRHVLRFRPGFPAGRTLDWTGFDSVAADRDRPGGDHILRLMPMSYSGVNLTPQKKKCQAYVVCRAILHCTLYNISEMNRETRRLDKEQAPCRRALLRTRSCRR